MIASGIVDPTKVTRSSLENAASIAACVLTTESLVVDKPDPAADAAMAAAAAQGGGKTQTPAHGGGELEFRKLFAHKTASNNHKKPPGIGLGVAGPDSLASMCVQMLYWSGL